jgi:hypothetical protein
VCVESPALGGGSEVDIVDPDPRAAHDVDPAPGGLEDVASDLGPEPDNEHIAERDLGAELLGGEAILAVDVGELQQQREPRGTELLDTLRRARWAWAWACARRGRRRKAGARAPHGDGDGTRMPTTLLVQV